MQDVLEQFIDIIGTFIGGMIEFVGTFGGQGENAFLPVIILFVVGIAIATLTSGIIPKVIASILIGAAAFAAGSWLGLPGWSALLIGIVAMGVIVSLTTWETWKDSKRSAIIPGIIVAMTVAASFSIVDRNVGRVGPDLRAAANYVSTFVRRLTNEATSGNNEKNREERRERQNKQQK